MFIERFEQRDIKRNKNKKGRNAFFERYENRPLMHEMTWPLSVRIEKHGANDTKKNRHTQTIHRSSHLTIQTRT